MEKVKCSVISICSSFHKLQQPVYIEEDERVSEKMLTGFLILSAFMGSCFPLNASCQYIVSISFGIQREMCHVLHVLVGEDFFWSPLWS